MYNFQRMHSPIILVISSCTQIVQSPGCMDAHRLLADYHFFVSLRLSFIEFMRQLIWMERQCVKAEKNETHVSRCTMYGDFSIGCDAILKVQDFMRDAYHFQSGKAKEYHPKGYVNETRTHKMKVKGIYHEHDEHEDLIQNCLPKDALQRIK